jgi:uncharacterized protein CbrC (UPF0167 family)
VTLPTFKYHPDPIGTESIATSDAVCVCCESARGYIYVGPVWSEHELDQSLCPWCIADGSAHAKFAASFTDEGGIGGYADWEPVPKQTIEDVAYRTPGFTGWQQSAGGPIAAMPQRSWAVQERPNFWLTEKTQY